MGSEMCIRDRKYAVYPFLKVRPNQVLLRLKINKANLSSRLWHRKILNCDKRCASLRSALVSGYDPRFISKACRCSINSLGSWFSIAAAGVSRRVEYLKTNALSN